MSQPHYKALTKCELAQHAGVSLKVLGRWLNVHYYEELIPLGYSKNDVTLKPNIVKYLCDKLCIIIDESPSK